MKRPSQMLLACSLCGAAMYSVSGFAFVPASRPVLRSRSAPGITAVRMVTESSGLLATTAELAKQVDELAQLMQSLKAAKGGTASPAAAAAALQPAAVAATAAATTAGKQAKSSKPVPLVCETYTAPTPEFVQAATVNALEAQPYWDQTGIPMNTYKPKEPYTGTITSVRR
jgi:hypothetical protein